MEELHKPVLLSEVLEILQPGTGESYLDLTAGMQVMRERFWRLRGIIKNRF